jgi:hypothetical protein
LLSIRAATIRRTTCSIEQPDLSRCARRKRDVVRPLNEDQAERPDFRVAPPRGQPNAGRDGNPSGRAIRQKVKA